MKTSAEQFILTNITMNFIKEGISPSFFMPASPADAILFTRFLTNLIHPQKSLLTEAFNSGTL
jgi:hypothetical protein